MIFYVAMSWLHIFIMSDPNIALDKVYSIYCPTIFNTLFYCISIYTGGCDESFVATSGIILSPSYPESNYPVDITCLYNIKSSVIANITLEFIHFEIEGEIGACIDYLKVRFASCTFTHFKGHNDIIILFSYFDVQSKLSSYYISC